MIQGKEGLSRKNVINFVFICTLAICLVFMFNFSMVNAQITSVFNSGRINSTNYSIINSGQRVNEDVAHVYNITVNHTANYGFKVANITIHFLEGNFTLNPYLGNPINAAANNLTIGVNGISDIFSFVQVVNGSEYIIWNASNSSTYIFAENNSKAINVSWFFFNATMDTPGDYNMTLITRYLLANGSLGNLSTYEHNVTIHINDTTVPVVDRASFSNANGLNRTPTTNAVGNYSEYLLLNISLSDNGGAIRSVFFNLSYNENVSTNGSHWWYRASNLSTSPDWWYYNLNTNNLPDGFYNVSVFVNDSNGNINSTTHINITIDNTDPTGDMQCGPVDSYISSTVTCTCTSSDALSGVSSTSYTASPSTVNAGEGLTQECTIVDKAGNTAVITSNKYNIWGSPSGGGPSGGTPTVTKTTTIGEIIPGTPKVITSIDSSTNVKEIIVEVSSIANNVKIDVNKYESKPSAISVSNPGSYKYIQINTQNLANKLSKATMKIYVEKSWISSSGIDKEDVALFKYDETNEEWNQLTTTYDSEDSDYYYYAVELTSFSYFSIAPKEGVEYTEPGEGGEEAPEAKKDFTWLWVTIIVVILILIIASGIGLAKRRKK